MSLHRRISSLHTQDRAYLEGVIEWIDGVGHFIDEWDEAIPIEELNNIVEVFHEQKWVQAEIINDSLIKVNNKLYDLTPGEFIRVKKKLFPLYEEWIDELTDDSFRLFCNTLNKLQYSIYDCLYCSNFLAFQNKKHKLSGTNFILYDNHDIICNVQHHYERDPVQKLNTDRFEFTLNNGKRLVCGHLI